MDTFAKKSGSAIKEYAKCAVRWLIGQISISRIMWLVLLVEEII